MKRVTLPEGEQQRRASSTPSGSESFSTFYLGFPSQRLAAPQAIIYVAFSDRKLGQETGTTKSALARRMNTSRTVVDRVLDGTDASLTLDTMTRAATALGRRIKVDLVAG